VEEDLMSRRWASATGCPIDQPAALGRPSDAIAVECAEAFIVRNGYTETPAVADTTQLAFESLEFARTIAELREKRRGMLESRAYGVCAGPSAWGGFAVVFRYAPGAFGGRLAVDGATVGRVVTMDTTLAHLRVQHQDVYLAAVEKPNDGCRLLDRGER
jgi:hypothetical protein